MNNTTKQSVCQLICALTSEPSTTLTTGFYGEDCSSATVTLQKREGGTTTTCDVCVGSVESTFRIRGFRSLNVSAAITISFNPSVTFTVIHTHGGGRRKGRAREELKRGRNQGLCIIAVHPSSSSPREETRTLTQIGSFQPQFTGTRRKNCCSCSSPELSGWKCNWKVSPFQNFKRGSEGRIN